jgi:hypothetical protein
MTEWQRFVWNNSPIHSLDLKTIKLDWRNKQPNADLNFMSSLTVDNNNNNNEYTVVIILIILIIISVII